MGKKFLSEIQLHSKDPLVFSDSFLTGCILN